MFLSILIIEARSLFLILLCSNVFIQLTFLKFFKLWAFYFSCSSASKMTDGVDLHIFKLLWSTAVLRSVLALLIVHMLGEVISYNSNFVLPNFVLVGENKRSSFCLSFSIFKWCLLMSELRFLWSAFLCGSLFSVTILCFKVLF